MVPIIHSSTAISEKSSLLHPNHNTTTTTYNKYIKFIDFYLCKIVHNPLVSSLLIIASITLIQSFQLAQLIINHSTTQSFIFLDDYALDLISNLINLLFIVRFQCFITFPLVIEIGLFLTQNLICLNLLFNQKYNVLALLNWNLNQDGSSDGNVFLICLKIFLIIQIIFPYIILIINIVDYNQQQQHHQQNGHKFHSFLIDCNNNYLPIFISHSFLFINYNFPLMLISSTTTTTRFIIQFKHGLIMIYKLSSFSMKFYAIYKFILYEMVLILYNITNIGDYSQFYTNCKRSPRATIKLEEEQQEMVTDTTATATTTTTSFERATNSLMVMASSYIILIDLIFISLSLYSSTHQN